MRRFHTQLGKVLAIASFAMLLATQWLHSPLLHVVESLESHAQTEHAEAHQEHGHSHHHSKTQADQQAHSHGCCHSHGHAHPAAADGKPTCPHPHPHPAEDCHICSFLTERASTLSCDIEISGTESVEFAIDAVAIFFSAPSQYRAFVRGPPVLS
ncbi:hypothetical protein [Thalassoglobus polymorphus]|uniref:DUF2946 domain-containing protein n=1 Tax=Thalassoglobus polymorphus TaxID=2527994 RepID=A0A517QHG1_9PLAN|nr:hypothetical protein [Thalassoglobus polymorphus]QDT31072.1 hypothetical protein Mal48_03030 [Thalassoglobus polymorphus]